MKRYFNLKEGSPNVNGVVLLVDLESRISERIKDFSGGGYEFRPDNKDIDGRTYNVSCDSTHFVGPVRQGTPYLAIPDAPLQLGHKDPPKHYQLRINKDGSLEVLSKRKNLFLSEVSERTARKMRGDASNWDLMQMYVAGM